jgi:hypothetical protein
MEITNSLDWQKVRSELEVSMRTGILTNNAPNSITQLNNMNDAKRMLTNIGNRVKILSEHEITARRDHTAYSQKVVSATLVTINAEIHDLEQWIFMLTLMK